MDNKCYSSASGGDVSFSPSSMSPAAAAAVSSPANDESGAAPSGLPPTQLSWPFSFLTRQFPAMFAATSDTAAMSPRTGEHQFFPVTSVSPSSMTSADVMTALQQQQQQMTTTPKPTSPQTTNLPQYYSTLLLQQQQQQQQLFLQQFLAKTASSTKSIPQLSSLNVNNNMEDEQNKSNGFGNSNGSMSSRASSARSDIGAGSSSSAATQQQQQQQQQQQSVQHTLQFDMDGSAICPVCDARIGAEPRDWNAHVRVEAQRLRVLIKSIGDSTTVQTAASSSNASVSATLERLEEVRKRRELELQRIRLNQAKRRGEVKTLLTAAGSASSTSPSTSSCTSSSSSSTSSSVSSIMTTAAAAAAAAAKEASSNASTDAAAGSCCNNDRRLAANDADSNAAEGERSGAASTLVASTAISTSTKDNGGPFANNNNNNNKNIYDGKCSECHRMADPLVVSAKNGGVAAAWCWDCFHERFRRESGTSPPSTMMDEMESAHAGERVEDEATKKRVRATATATRLAAIHNIDTLLLKKEDATRCHGDGEAAVERRVDDGLQSAPPTAPIAASSGKSAHAMAELFPSSVTATIVGGKRRRVMMNLAS